MKLLFDELISSPLSQTFTTPSAPQDVYGVHLHLIKYLQPSGGLFVVLRDSQSNVLYQTATLPISTIHTTGFSGANYGHGDIRFLLPYQLAASTEYILQLYPDGYSYSSTAFIGWCRDFDLARYSSYGSVGSKFLYAFSTYQWKTKGD